MEDTQAPEGAVATIVRFDSADPAKFEAAFKLASPVMLDICNKIQVYDQGSLELAAAVYAACRDNQAAAKKHYDAERDARYKEYKAVLAKIKIFDEAYGACATVLEPKIKAYVDAQNAQHAEVAGEIAATSSELKAEIVQKIAELKEAGEFKEARRLQAELDGVVDMVPQQERTVQAASVSLAKELDWEITDPMLTIKSVADGTVDRLHTYERGSVKELRPLVVIDETLLNNLVAKQGLKLNIPGVRVFETTGLRRKATK